MVLMGIWVVTCNTNRSQNPKSVILNLIITAKSFSCHLCNRLCFYHFLPWAYKRTEGHFFYSHSRLLCQNYYLVVNIILCTMTVAFIYCSLADHWKSTDSSDGWSADKPTDKLAYHLPNQPFNMPKFFARLMVSSTDEKNYTCLR